MVFQSIIPLYSAARAEMTTDAPASDQMRAALLALQARLEAWVAAARRTTKASTQRVEAVQRAGFARAVKTALSFDNSGLMHASDVEPLLDAAVERNVSLIRGLTDDMRRDVERIVWDGMLNQVPRAKIAKDISVRTGIAKKRAVLIARDQTAKLTGELDRFRQEQAGIGKYKWRHSGKENFRPQHLARDGRFYFWNKPPADGHPRSLPNCGCTAQAVVEIKR